MPATLVFSVFGFTTYTHTHTHTHTRTHTHTHTPSAFILCSSHVSASLYVSPRSLTSRKWQDDEITDDVNVVGDTLERFVITLSSYEKYSAEVLSGNLEWSPVHNEKFWRENISKFEDDNFNLIKYVVASGVAC